MVLLLLDVVTVEDTANGMPCAWPGPLKRAYSRGGRRDRTLGRPRRCGTPRQFGFFLRTTITHTTQLSLYLRTKLAAGALRIRSPHLSVPSNYTPDDAAGHWWHCAAERFTQPLLDFRPDRH